MDRQTAYKVRISDLLDGKYVVEEGWEPNYIELKNGRRVSRVNLLCTVVGKDSVGVTADDGSGKILVRSFDENNVLNSVDVGETVVLIGKPREYGGERYVVPEIIKKISDSKWLHVRKIELEKTKDSIAVKEHVLNVEEELINLIRGLDKGDGVDVAEIIGRVADGEKGEDGKDGEGEVKVRKLLEQGEIFEVKPGRVKVLE